jgi:hypothetical protein
MSFYKINKAMKDAVLAIPSMPEIDFENKKFEKVVGNKYLRYTNIPAPQERLSQGKNGVRTNSGMIQIDVIVPAFSGDDEAYKIADLILEYFEQNRYPSYDDVTVRLLEEDLPYITQGTLDSDTWFIVPVTLPYVSYINRSIT